MTEPNKTPIQQKLHSRLGERSIFMINHVGHLITRLANRELTKAGFSLQIEQLPVLFITYFAGDEQLSQQAIADLLQKDKSGIQRSVRTLERDGYLRIVADSLDRRKNLIQLTPAGKLVVEKVIETAEHIDKIVTEKISPTEINALMATMRKIATVLDN